MSLTTSADRELRKRRSSSNSRIAAGAAALLGISLFMTVAVMNVPHDATDSELVAWWQDSANRFTGTASAIWALLVAASAAVVVNHLATVSAAQRSPQWLAFARSMGTAVTGVWLVTAAARGVIAHLVDFLDQPLPGADTLRAMTALNYMWLGLSGMFVLALLILAVSVVAFRTGAFPRWFGIIGAVCSAVMLVAVVAQYGAFSTPLAILWSLCLSVVLWRSNPQEQ